MYEYQYKNGDHVSDWCDSKADARANFIAKYGAAEFQESTLLQRPLRG